MKIRPEHFNHLKKTIDDYLESQGKDDMIQRYESGNFFRSDKTKDLQTRFNFDMMYAAGLTNFVCDELYKYMNDTHIATALNKICPKVTRKY